MTRRPQATIRRRVHWFDTDASTKEHNSAPLRWMEEAEAALLDDLGIVKRVYGSMPRVHVSIDYRRPLRFWDDVEVTVRILELGRSSITYAFDVRHDGGVAVEGRVVAAYIGEDGTTMPWPDDLREILGATGSS